MAIVTDSDIDRAVERRLTATRPQRVQFSPLFSEPLADARRKKRSLVWTSIGVHVLFAIVVMLLPRKAQTFDEPALPVEITFRAPVPEVKELVLPKPAPLPKPKPVERPKPVKVEEPKPKAFEPEPVPDPVVEPAPAPPPVAKVEPPKPRPAVRTGLLDESTGPPIMGSKNSRSTLVVSSGFDTEAKGSVTQVRPGRVVEVAGFGSAPAAKSRGRGSPGGVVQSTGFSEEVAAPAVKKREPERPLSPLDSEVEILSRPKPVYTEEARALRLEGDVVLSVVFEAGGVLRILGVAQGLGHGLDEAAVDAAKRIRFNPARRDGAPVDHAAKLRVVFRLA